ncbi:MAG: hypothetical protein IKM78_03355 [Prevotella sp.]|nr:hypothetical protein [Prevotella sp.]
MKKYLMTLAAVICCTFTMAVLTACTDSSDNPVPSTDPADIVGDWCSNVSGKTFAKWNYGDTWQNTVFKADGTGSTHIYYLIDDDVAGCENIDFTYAATADGTLTMTPKDRDKITAKWQIVGGQLKIDGGDRFKHSFDKTTPGMITKFDTWSKDDEMILVPQPAKYTVFVYGNAGGTMDNIIEQGLWERAKEFLTDHNNVRVVCLYKYGKDDPDAGKPFTGKYAEPGDIVWFELDSETDLNKIKESGMQAYGMGEEAKQLKICNPSTMRMFLEFSSLHCPAQNYVLAIWGHGSGFYALQDVPGKYPEATTRGVMVDEWVNNEWMDMYELGYALKGAGIDKLSTLMFHNCYMGNIESITEIKDYADYIIASAHVLGSDGLLMTEFVRGLKDEGNPVDAGYVMFQNSIAEWPKEYVDEAHGEYNNGDYKMIRTDKFDPLVDLSKQLCDRILELYPTQKEAINKATSQVYRIHQLSKSGDFILYFNNPFFDIADYAHQLAKETGDAEFKAISDALDAAFDEAFVHYYDINNSVQHLDHYTLTVNLIDKDYYVFDYKNTFPTLYAVCNFKEGYEQCTFHKLTGWGNWLSINEQLLDRNPQRGGGGKLE